MSLVSVALITATPRPTPTAEGDPSSIGPGSLGFWVVVLLAVALFFLYRSMRKQMRRIEFDPAGATDEERMRGRSSADADPAEDASEGPPVDGQPTDHPSRPSNGSS